jgi:hypothetical protein
MADPKISIAPRRSMAFFASLTILMTIISYAFLLALAAASVYLPFLGLRITSGNVQRLLLFLFGVAVAGVLLWYIVPRRDHFTPPGPVLLRSTQPKLFAELDRIAGMLDQ